MVTRQEAIDNAGKALAEGYELLDTLPVEEAARRAYTPTGPSIAELEAGIRARRGITEDLLSKFERQLDPDGALDPRERAAIRAEHARKATKGVTS